MKLKSLYIAVLALGLVACDKTTQIQNGQVPAALMPLAQNLTGNYEGSFDGIANTLTVSLVGDRMVMSPRFDLLGANCASTVGNLQSVTLATKDKQVTAIKSADFALNPGNCARSTAARNFTITNSVGRDGSMQMNVEMLVGYHWERYWEPGRVECTYNRRGESYCWQTPGYERSWQVADYATGSFTKH